MATAQVMYGEILVQQGQMDEALHNLASAIRTHS